MSVATTTHIFLTLQGIIFLHYIVMIALCIISNYRAKRNPYTVITFNEWLNNHRYNMSYILIATPILISWILDIAFVLYILI